MRLILEKNAVKYLTKIDRIKKLAQKNRWSKTKARLCQ